MGIPADPLRTARAQYHLRQVMVFLNMHPVHRPEIMIGNAPQGFDEQGRLVDEKIRGQIRSLLENLCLCNRQLQVTSLA